jgi:hypothetical protein
LSNKPATMVAFSAVLLIAAMLTACSKPPSVTGEAVASGEVSQTEQYPIKTSSGAVGQLGDQVGITDALSASVRISASGGRGRRLAEVRLFRTDDGNAPVDGATIAASVAMRAMPQMLFTEDVTPAGAGAYEIPLRFSMPGEWQLRLRVLSGPDVGDLAVNLQIPEGS